MVLNNIKTIQLLRDSLTRLGKAADGVIGYLWSSRWTFLKNKNSFFDRIFLKWRPSGCTLALDFLYEEDFPHNNLLQRGSKRPQEKRRGCSCGVLLLFGGGCSGKNCSGVIGFPQRGEFPGEQTVWVLLRRYSKYALHLRNRLFLLHYIVTFSVCFLQCPGRLCCNNTGTRERRAD
jgi:hypothetical protein